MKIKNPLNINIDRNILDIAKAISKQGGKAYLVGGASIDLLNGNQPKDYDIEVFNFSYENLATVASTFGKAELVGKKFGVVKLKISDLNIDLSIPRLENSVGPGHKDFEIKLVTNLTVAEAAKRRDFTINSIYIDIENNQILDPYSGIIDLTIGRLHYIDEETFIEDPLRAFRAIQIVARKGQFWSTELHTLVLKMLDDVKQTSGEAIFGELNKLLMLSNKPSVGLNNLCHPCYLEEKTNKGLITLFPELDKLRGCPQNPEYHKEGDVWRHTLLAIDGAAKYRNKLPEEWQLAYMYGILLHDIGKPDCLKEWKHMDSIVIKTNGHQRVGADLARIFMERLTNNEKLIEKVCSIVRTHMRPRQLIQSSARATAWARLHNLCPLNILAYVSIADEDARGLEEVGESAESFKRCIKEYKRLGEPRDKIPAVLMGRDLIERGHTPGKEFGPILESAYNFQMATGCKDKEILYLVGTRYKISSLDDADNLLVALSQFEWQELRKE